MEVKSNFPAISALVKKERQARGLTMEQLGALSQTSLPIVRRIEHGKVVSLIEVEKVLWYLGYTLEIEYRMDIESPHRV